MNPDVTVIVQQPFDFVGSVLIPVAAIVVAAGIAIWIATAERRASDRAHVRAQAARFIKALNALGRASLLDDNDAKNESYARYEQELNAFAAYLNKNDVVVAKFVCVVAEKIH